MGMIKEYMMGVQEEGRQASDDGVERKDNPYINTMWEKTWQEAWEGRTLDCEADYLDGLAEKEDYARCPDLQISYCDGPR